MGQDSHMGNDDYDEDEQTLADNGMLCESEMWREVNNKTQIMTFGFWKSMPADADSTTKGQEEEETMQHMDHEVKKKRR